MYEGCYHLNPNPDLVWMLKASLHNKVKPTREETSYPVVIAQPITATRKPPPPLTTSKYRALGGNSIEVLLNVLLLVCTSTSISIVLGPGILWSTLTVFNLRLTELLLSSANDLFNGPNFWLTLFFASLKLICSIR